MPQRMLRSRKLGERVRTCRGVHDVQQPGGGQLPDGGRPVLRERVLPFLRPVLLRVQQHLLRDSARRRHGVRRVVHRLRRRNDGVLLAEARRLLQRRRGPVLRRIGVLQPG